MTLAGDQINQDVRGSQGSSSILIIQGHSGPRFHLGGDPQFDPVGKPKYFRQLVPYSQTNALHTRVHRSLAERARQVSERGHDVEAGAAKRVRGRLLHGLAVREVAQRQEPGDVALVAGLARGGHGEQRAGEELALCEEEPLARGDAERLVRGAELVVRAVLASHAVDDVGETAGGEAGGVKRGREEGEEARVPEELDDGEGPVGAVDGVVLVAVQFVPGGEGRREERCEVFECPALEVRHIVFGAETEDAGDDSKIRCMFVEIPAATFAGRLMSGWCRYGYKEKEEKGQSPGIVQRLEEVVQV